MKLEGEEDEVPKTQAFIQGDTFEEEPVPDLSEKVSKIKADDEFYRSKPKYIWIDIPRSKKKRSRMED